MELLDERSKQYTCAGDDAVSEAVTDLVRGSLCPAVKAVLEHGMRRPSFLGGPCHPWLFIEEASTREVEKDFNSVYSRLVLCKTYRLDEDGKVLTPEEVTIRIYFSSSQYTGKSFGLKFIPNQSDLFWNLYPSQSEFIRKNFSISLGANR